MSTITINGHTLELDLLDADVMEKYTDLNASIVEKISEPTQYVDLSAADGMRKQCRYIDEFFDKLFGVGTATEVFGGGNNLGVRMDAFAQVSAAAQNVRGELAAITDKYGIGRLNRDQRRGSHGKKNRYRGNGQD